MCLTIAKATTIWRYCAKGNGISPAQICNVKNNLLFLPNIQIHGLRGELDLAQRKLKTMENNMVKQGDKFQTEKEGLTIGTLDQKVRCLPSFRQPFPAVAVAESVFVKHLSRLDQGT